MENISLIEQSLKEYFNTELNWNEHVFGNHHQAIIGLFCSWWILKGSELGYTNPLLLTGILAGRKKGSKSGGNVADNIFAYHNSIDDAVVGILEVECAAQVTIDTIFASLQKCDRSIRNHKTEFKSLQWAIVFSPIWDESFDKNVMKERDLERQKRVNEMFSKTAKEIGITIFNCFARQQYRTGIKNQTKWWQIEIVTHSAEIK